MGQKESKGLVWFMKPNPCLLSPKDVQEYLVAGERVPPEDSVLLVRVYEHLVQDTTNAKHRIIYAILTIRTVMKAGGEKAIRKELPAIEKLIEAATQCAGHDSKTFSVLAYVLEKTGDVERAKKVYNAGYESVFCVGGRMLTTADVELLALYAAFGEEHGIDFAFKIGDVWKDCSLRAPESALAQGNYGLYLLRKGDMANGKARLERAVQLEKDPEGFWAEQLREHFQEGAKKKKKKAPMPTKLPSGVVQGEPIKGKK